MAGIPDPVELSQALVRCPSVTPENAGVLDLLQKTLEGIGFVCERMVFSAPGEKDVDNLYAKLGTQSPNFCFGGHTDVVPVGDAEAWTHDPFGGVIEDGVLYGRGANDMKSAVAAFASAAARFVEARGLDFGGTISMLITNDEEGPSVNGTEKMLNALAARNERLDAALIGEPTNPYEMGEMIKIGRRGMFNGWITVNGKQGHTAYPHLADNPIHHLAAMVSAIADAPVDDGSDHFQPTVLQITTIDVGNPAMNVIPAKATAAFNSRVSDCHTGETLAALLRERLDRVAKERGASYEFKYDARSDSFLTLPGDLSTLVTQAVQSHVGRKPDLTTTGGSSDARFFKDHCPVVEFGLVGRTMHQVDEQAEVAHIRVLTDIYETVLDGFFPG
jgi:succinyl-diaminopimelate desuccinylase